MDRNRLVFAGFLGMYFCIVALAGAGNPAFYAAEGLYCAGGMCELKRFRRRKRPQPEEAAAPQEPQPEEGV